MNYSLMDSPEAIALAKKETLEDINKMAALTKSSIKHNFLPDNDGILNSDFRWLRYVGYGITAVKTARTVFKVVGFIRGKLR